MRILTKDFGKRHACDLGLGLRFKEKRHEFPRGCLGFRSERKTHTKDREQRSQRERERERERAGKQTETQQDAEGVSRE